jgi:hypothetical protein
MMALDHESLWSKSKLLMDRALAARDQRQQEDFYLWIALVLEVLGKAHLAKFHPALVADPQHADSMLAVCAGVTTSEYRTITAKTVFARCVRTVPGFDAKAEQLCIRLANDRNAHLHSGELPFSARREAVWESKCWAVIDLLVKAQGRTLEELVGADEATAIEDVIADATKTHEVQIQRRVASHCEAFKRLDREERSLRQSAAKLLQQRIMQEGDTTRISFVCPSCGNLGSLDGEIGHAVRAEAVDPAEPWLRWFDCTLDAESFSCASCGLKLDGYEEIGAVGLPETYEKVIAREDVDIDSYGND